ncbi:hypothetical protein [Roseofilum sp. Belize Diploria]|nr:hypothetical protein [Roseofilum sp. Belize Diploria]MBP0007122.1 hypothetical protein [Roseofilum sp. Belize Diploria]
MIWHVQIISHAIAQAMGCAIAPYLTSDPNPQLSKGFKIQSAHLIFSQTL